MPETAQPRVTPTAPALRAALIRSRRLRPTALVIAAGGVAGALSGLVAVSLIARPAALLASATRPASSSGPTAASAPAAPPAAGPRVIGAPVELVLAHQDSPGGLAILGTGLYHVDLPELGRGNGHVARASTDPAIAGDEILAGGEIQDVAADDAGVCWTTADAVACHIAHFEHEGRRGEEPDLTIDAHGVPSDVVVRGREVYWLTFGGNPAFDRPSGELWRRRLVGGETEWLAGGWSGSGNLAVTDGTAYFTTCRDREYQDCVIESVDLAGGARRAYPASRGAIAALAADAHAVYWIDRQRGEIRGMNGAVGTPWIIATGQEDPRDLALDKERVYWLEHAAGRVRRAAKAGGDVVVLAADQRGPLHLALDARFIYWSCSGDGTIRRTAKLPPG